MANYPNFYLPSVYLSFSSDTHIVHINLSKSEANCFHLLLQKIRIHSLNFLLYQNRVSCFNKCLTTNFHSLTLGRYTFSLHVFNFDCDVIYVCLWSKFLWRIKTYIYCGSNDMSIMKLCLSTVMLSQFEMVTLLLGHPVHVHLPMCTAST